MGRDRSQFCCRECGWSTPRWAGRCAQCGEWNTLDEETLFAGPGASGGAAGLGGAGGLPRRPAAPPIQVREVALDDDRPFSTGIGELDRVLGGGLVPGSVTLMAGEPGIGKSTLLVQMLMRLAARGARTLLVSAEESAPQVSRRAARLGSVPDGLWLVAETDLGAVLQAVDQVKPELVVIDSIQTVSDMAVASAPGSVAQVKGCAQRLVDMAKSGGPSVVLVGHVTKEGAIAGPRVLEHLVDTVLAFEGDRHGSLRLLRAAKHRFGPVGELGIWDMTAEGLMEMPDGAPHLLAGRRPGVPGSVVLAAMDGRRPLLVEVQALVATPPPGASPRRSASGCDGARLTQLLAILERRAGLVAGNLDVYVSVAGGVRVTDPAADLAVALAVASATTGQVVADGLVVFGEVGLAGEVRAVAHSRDRLSEAGRLGFGRAVVPAGAGHGDIGRNGRPAGRGGEAGRGSASTDGLVVLEASTLAGVLDDHLGIVPESPLLRAVAE